MKHRRKSNHYRGPLGNTTDGIVDNNNCRSRKKDRRRKYLRSILIQDSNETVLRPRTCQTHVSPGRTARRFRCQGAHLRDSSMGRGLGPTSDISPISTFHSCGSSSKLVRRKKRPIHVVRGSFCILKAGPSCTLCARNFDWSKCDPRALTGAYTCGIHVRHVLRVIVQTERAPATYF